MYRWGHQMAITSTSTWKDGGGPKIMTNSHHTLVWQTWGLRHTCLKPQVIYFFFLFCYSLTTCNSMKQRWCQHLHLHLSLHHQTGGCLPKVFLLLLLSFFLLYWLDCPWSGPGPVQPLFADPGPGHGPVLDLVPRFGPGLVWVQTRTQVLQCNYF